MVFMADGGSESRTRDRVRRAVGSRGPVTARELASELELTPAAVRRHLDALADDGAIVEREVAAQAPRGRGRPARAYVLTDRGQEQLQTSYDDVATAALHYIEDHAGTHAVEAFAAEQMRGLEQRLTAAVADAGESVPARTEALASALSDEGFAATTRPVGQGTGLAGIQLCQGHCPVRHVATEFRQFCDAETDVISRVLGVHVQRLATLAGGEHVCTTFVPTGPISPLASLSDAEPDRSARPHGIPVRSPDQTHRERP
jgi:predicted ArsR family transcriptional regulator